MFGMINNLTLYTWLALCGSDLLETVLARCHGRSEAYRNLNCGDYIVPPFGFLGLSLCYFSSLET